MQRKLFTFLSKGVELGVFIIRTIKNSVKSTFTEIIVQKKLKNLLLYLSTVVCVSAKCDELRPSAPNFI